MPVHAQEEGGAHVAICLVDRLFGAAPAGLAMCNQKDMVCGSIRQRLIIMCMHKKKVG